jgi:hypothetical protein
LKTRETKFKSMANELHLGEEMARIAGTGKKSARVVATEVSSERASEDASREVASVSAALSHPPRPRKKQRR